MPSAESDVDDTGAVLQALAAAGQRGGAVSRRAVAYLRATQNRDGGFGQSEGRASNAQSTAWAVQGLVAAGISPRSVGADPIRYLLRLQRRDGHISYSRASDQTPVWVTAQASPRPAPQALSAGHGAAQEAAARPQRRVPLEPPRLARPGEGRDRRTGRPRRGRGRADRAAPLPDAASPVAQSPTSARAEPAGDDGSSAAPLGHRGGCRVRRRSERYGCCGAACAARRLA